MEIEKRIENLMALVSMIVVTVLALVFGVATLIYWRYFDV